MSFIKTLLNNTQEKRQCVICRQNGGILICHGCQSTFCAKHATKHREELACQLDDIMQGHRGLREDIEQPLNEYLYLRRIEQWEKESIKKIRKAAEAARAQLRKGFDRSKRQLTRIAQDIKIELNTSWKADDFAEKELRMWTKQLNELQGEIKSAYSVQLTEDQRYPIYPITIITNHSRNGPTANKLANFSPYERFSAATSSVSIEHNGLIAKHIGPNSEYAHILGKRLYSQGYHTIRFQILETSDPYSIFFGCVSSEIPQNFISYNSSAAVGWFGYNEIYHHGVWNNNFAQHGYDSDEIETGDVLGLVLDCANQQVELIHERINRTYRLPVNINKAPFPWQILVVLVNKNDCVKMLTKR